VLLTAADNFGIADPNHAAPARRWTSAEDDMADSKRLAIVTISALT
jgi:hypothetical protein